MSSTLDTSLTLEEIRSIAKEAYLYGWPMSENYNTFFSYINDGHKTNQILNEARVYTPEDKTVVTPNSDTPYSYIWADLRSEPLVITVPTIPKERYFSFQLIDLYTHNFSYIGTRTTGSEERRNYLLAGPNWTEVPLPASIESEVLHCETELCLALVRTQLFNPDDLDAVKEIQARYRVQTLSQFLDTDSPQAAPEIESWPFPLKGVLGKTLNLFSTLDFLLQFCPTHPSERALMRRLAKIGIGTDRPFQLEDLTPEVQGALQEGVAAAWEEFARFEENELGHGIVTSSDLFGTRRFLKNNYLYRFAGAKIGLYGNSMEEAYYPMYTSDSQGGKLDGAQFDYTLTIPKFQLPAKAFWSITMYDKETQLLIDNPIDRYLVNSPMWDDFAKNDGSGPGQEGSVTFYIQSTEPADPEHKKNWLPAPNGRFYMTMRLYLPGNLVLNGNWTQPELHGTSRA